MKCLIIIDAMCKHEDCRLRVFGGLGDKECIWI